MGGAWDVRALCPPPRAEPQVDKKPWPGALYALSGSPDRPGRAGAYRYAGLHVQRHRPLPVRPEAGHPGSGRRGPHCSYAVRLLGLRPHGDAPGDPLERDDGHGGKAHRKKAVPLVIADPGGRSGAYGLYAFWRRDFGNYMLLRYHFVFFDWEEGLLPYLLDAVAILALFVIVGHYLSVGAKRLGRKNPRKGREA